MKALLDIKDQVTLPCCGCSGQAMFTPQGEHPTFFHTMPYCERFNSTNTIDELLAYFRDCSTKLLNGNTN